MPGQYPVKIVGEHGSHMEAGTADLAGVRDTLRRMAETTLEASQDSRIRQLAESISRSPDVRARAFELWAHVNAFPFWQDPPGVDVFKDPRITLLGHPQGDCGSHAMAVAALAASAGIRFRFVATSQDGVIFSHVFAELWTCDKWTVADTVPGASWDQPAPAAVREVFEPAGQPGGLSGGHEIIAAGGDTLGALNSLLDNEPSEVANMGAIQSAAEFAGGLDVSYATEIASIAESIKEFEVLKNEFPRLQTVRTSLALAGTKGAGAFAAGVQALVVTGLMESAAATSITGVGLIVGAVLLALAGLVTLGFLLFGGFDWDEAEENALAAVDELEKIRVVAATERDGFAQTFVFGGEWNKAYFSNWLNPAAVAMLWDGTGPFASLASGRETESQKETARAEIWSREMGSQFGPRLTTGVRGSIRAAVSFKDQDLLQDALDVLKDHAEQIEDGIDNYAILFASAVDTMAEKERLYDRIWARSSELLAEWKQRAERSLTDIENLGAATAVWVNTAGALPDDAFLDYLAGEGMGRRWVDNAIGFQEAWDRALPHIEAYEFQGITDRARASWPAAEVQAGWQTAGFVMLKELRRVSLLWARWAEGLGFFQATEGFGTPEDVAKFEAGFAETLAVVRAFVAEFRDLFGLHMFPNGVPASAFQAELASIDLATQQIAQSPTALGQVSFTLDEPGAGGGGVAVAAAAGLAVLAFL